MQNMTVIIHIILGLAFGPTSAGNTRDNHSDGCQHYRECHEVLQVETQAT